MVWQEIGGAHLVGSLPPRSLRGKGWGWGAAAACAGPRRTATQPWCVPPSHGSRGPGPRDRCRAPASTCPRLVPSPRGGWCAGWCRAPGAQDDRRWCGGRFGVRTWMTGGGVAGDWGCGPGCLPSPAQFAGEGLGMGGGRGMRRPASNRHTALVCIPSPHAVCAGRGRGRGDRGMRRGRPRAARPASSPTVVTVVTLVTVVTAVTRPSAAPTGCGG